jgi:hypothetical protein
VSALRDIRRDGTKEDNKSMNPVRIHVTFTQTLDKERWLLHGLYGYCSAHTPKQLRAIAAALTKIATH